MYHAPLLVRQLKPVDCQYVAQLELYAFVNSFWEEHSVVIVNLRNNLALEHIANLFRMVPHGFHGNHALLDDTVGPFMRFN